MSKNAKSDCFSLFFLLSKVCGAYKRALYKCSFSRKVCCHAMLASKVLVHVARLFLRVAFVALVETFALAFLASSFSS